MSDEEADVESGQQAVEDQVAKIDLSQYRTGALVERLTELISVPRALRNVAVTALMLAILVFVTCVVIFLYSGLSGVGWLLLCAYALAIGFVFGVILGILRVVGQALLHVESILRIILEIASQAATDWGQLQTGKTRMPTGGELIEQVYDDVVMPALEKAVAGAFGFLGKPLLWAYRRSIGSAVRYLVKWVNPKWTTNERAKTFEQQAHSGLITLAKYSETIQAYTSSAAEVVSSTGKKIHLYAMRPLYVVFFACLSLATFPILVLRYLATGEPPE